MATDHGRRQQKSNTMANRGWNYLLDPPRGFKISREDLAKQVKEFKKGKK